MKIATRIGLLLVTACFIAPSTAGDDPWEKMIKARKAEMRLQAFNVQPLFAMAKGKEEYDAELAAKLAGNLKLLLDFDNGRAWQKGSDNKAYPGQTTALPTIWSTYPEIVEYFKRYNLAVNNVAKEAGNGLEALKGAIGPLGKTCKDCHDNFREQK